MRALALGLAATVTLAGMPMAPLSAALIDGGKLKGLCFAPVDTPTYGQDVAWCRAYISGVYDDFMAAREIAKQPSCEPADLKPDEIVDTILRAMKDQPAFDDSAASYLIQVSIISA